MSDNQSQDSALLSLDSFVRASTVPGSAPQIIHHDKRKWMWIEHAANRRKGSKVSPAWDLGHEYISLDNPNGQMRQLR